MLTPTKHEDLEKNMLVIGAELIDLLKGHKYNIESLFFMIKERKEIGLDQFYNILTFLWLSGIIEVDQFFVELYK